MARLKLTRTMQDLLVSMLLRQEYPVDRNNGRTFQALEERGLIHPDFYDQWHLTDEGHQVALNLLKK